MSNINREELMKKITEFLDTPGICLPEDKKKILDICKKASEEQLADVVASLRIYVRRLLKTAQSKDVRQAIVDSKKHFDELLKKYAV